MYIDDMYYDIDREAFVSFEELRKEFEELKAENGTDATTLAEYVRNCMYFNNGTLTNLDGASWGDVIYTDSETYIRQNYKNFMVYHLCELETRHTVKKVWLSSKRWKDENGTYYEYDGIGCQTGRKANSIKEIAETSKN